MAEVTASRCSIADYEALPEGAPYQLIDGELVMSPAPVPSHQRALRRLVVVLDAYVSERGAGEILFAPVDVYLTSEDVYQPDLLFVSDERRGIIGEKNIQGAPDLVVEILSPSTGYYDLTIKRRTYEEAGVREYWMVDLPARRVEVYENRNGRFELISEAEEGDPITSSVLSGLALTPHVLFQK